MSNTERFLPIKTVRNLRDFGGLQTEDGRTVKSGMCYRSAALDKVSRRDQKNLKKQYGLTQVIDLRTDVERSEKPDLDIKGITNYHMPLFGTEVPGITKEEGATGLDQLKNLPDLKGLYPYILTSEYAQAQLRDIFSMIIDNEDGAMLWHCSEGKDRCGTVSALFLLLLGVDRETVMEDYLLTNIANRKKRHSMYALVLLATRSKKLADKVLYVYSAVPDFLQASFDTIDSLGGTDAYFRDLLGITDEQRQKAKDKYLQ